MHLFKDGLLDLLLLLILEETQELGQNELNGILLADDWAKVEYGIGQ
jgi:hypothetical protein